MPAFCYPYPEADTTVSLPLPAKRRDKCTPDVDRIDVPARFTHNM
jgi:hypothetical protein